MTEVQWIPYLSEFAWLIFFIGFAVSFCLGFIAGQQR
jgi:hypothetical protein